MDSICTLAACEEFSFLIASYRTLEVLFFKTLVLMPFCKTLRAQPQPEIWNQTCFSMILIKVDQSLLSHRLTRKSQRLISELIWISRFLGAKSFHGLITAWRGCYSGGRVVCFLKHSKLNWLRWGWKCFCGSSTKHQKQLWSQASSGSWKHLGNNLKRNTRDTSGNTDILFQKKQG